MTLAVLEVNVSSSVVVVPADALGAGADVVVVVLVVVVVVVVLDVVVVVGVAIGRAARPLLRRVVGRQTEGVNLSESHAPRIGVALRRGENVTPLELFFDLVFVLAITQCTALMAHDATWRGIAHGLVVLGLLWWSWVGYAWLTSVVDPRQRRGAPRVVRGDGRVARLLAVRP